MRVSMNRVDAFDMSVLSLEDGVRWAADAVERDSIVPGDRLAAIYYPHLLQAIRNRPEILRTYVLKDRSLALSDMFLDIISRAPEGAMREYEALRAMVRRFGTGANDWVSRKWQSSEDFTRREDADEVARSNDAPGYARLSRIAEIDLYSMDAHLVAFLCHHMMDLASKTQGWDVVRNCAHFDFANDTVVMGMPSQSEDAFGHIIPDTFEVPISYFPASGAAHTILKGDLIGYSIFEYFAPYARRVRVSPDGVSVDFRADPRPRKQPLFYEYSQGAGRRGVESNDSSLLRVEVRANSRLNSSGIFGTIAGICRAYERGADLYIEGSQGTSSGRFDIIGDPFGFEEGVVDLVATGPEAQTALMSAFTALGGFSMRAV
jgi:hypothetical protein